MAGADLGLEGDVGLEGELVGEGAAELEGVLADPREIPAARRGGDLARWAQGDRGRIAHRRDAPGRELAPIDADLVERQVLCVKAERGVC